MKIVGRNFLDDTETELGPYNDIAFGEGRDRVTISVRDGQIDIRSLHGRLRIVPQASNCIYVAAMDWE